MSKQKKKKAESQKKQAAIKKTTNKEHPPEPKKKSPAHIMTKPNWALTGLATAGMILTAYLAISGWLSEGPLLCSDGSSCDLVQQSRWGTFLALPTAFWGFLTYSTLFYISIKVRQPGTHWKSAWTVSMVGLGYSAYLLAISLFVIQAVCLYCIASFTIMAIIFGVVTFQRSQKLSKLKLAAFARQTVIITAILVGGMHLHYSGVFDPMAGPEDPYLKGLAVHLTQEKAILYGAYW